MDRLYKTNLLASPSCCTCARQNLPKAVSGCCCWLKGGNWCYYSRKQGFQQKQRGWRVRQHRKSEHQESLPQLRRSCLGGRALGAGDPRGTGCRASVMVRADGGDMRRSRRGVLEVKDKAAGRGILFYLFYFWVL